MGVSVVTRLMTGVVAVAACLLATSVPALADVGTVSQYPIGVDAQPYEVTAGPDGNIWFASYTNTAGHPAVGRMTTGGTPTVIQLPTNDPAPWVTTGPDGNMWLGQGGHIDTLSPSATMTSQITQYSGGGTGLIAGPDGRVWYFPGDTSISAITTGGSIQDYPTGATATSQNVIVGPDNQLWFGADFEVEQMTTSGTVTPITTSAMGDTPYVLALGPDGNVWFTLPATNQIGKVTPAGVESLFNIPTASAGPFGIAAGPDGRMWFTERGKDKIGAIPTTATSGADIQEYPVSGSNLGLFYITRGPDGRMWFNENNADAIGAITTGAGTPTFALTVTPAGNGSGSVASQPAGITCGTHCSASFPSGTMVGLTATPAAGARFAGWSGACTGTGACNVTMSVDRAVTATFERGAAPPPTCTLTPRSKKVVLRGPSKGKHPKTKPGTLLLLAKCNQDATVTVSAVVIESLGKNGKRHAQTFRPAKVTVSVKAGLVKMVAMKLPAGALNGLKRGNKESAKLKLLATNANGTGRASVTITGLRGVP